MAFVRRPKLPQRPIIRCPMCQQMQALHYVLGSICQVLECDWASCLDCGVTISRRDGKAVRSGSMVR